jgi:outer membrane protein
MNVGDRMNRRHLAILLAAACAAPVWGQAGGALKLTLAEAEAQALKNHPQILAAQNAASAMGQQVVQAKAPYYPVVAGELTGSGANQDARIGAGALATSRLFNRFGDGVTVSQLVSDFGRTPNLVATAKYRAEASQQTY